MVQVIRKKRETVLSLLKRFNRKMQQSSNLSHAKSIQYKSRNKSELKKKKEAISRARYQKKLARLYKLGKLEFTFKKE